MLKIILLSLFFVSPASAAFVAAPVPDAISDGVDFSAVLLLLFQIAGGIIGIYVAIKLISWMLLTFNGGSGGVSDSKYVDNGDYNQYGAPVGITSTRQLDEQWYDHQKAEGFIK